MNGQRVSKMMILVVTIALLCSSPLKQVSAMKINQKHQQQLEAIMSQQSDEKFLGTLLWDVFDLLSFGVFEKKPSNNTKNRKNNKTNESNYTNSTNNTTQANAQPTII